MSYTHYRAMDKSRIVEVLAKWNYWDKEIVAGVPRPKYVEKLLKFVETGKIISVVGVRRAGKSTLIRQLAKQLVDKGVEKKDILIVNFEEPAFDGADAGFLQRMYDAYTEIMKPSGTPFLFLDEVQIVRNWERFVRGLTERKEAFVVVTGSSSKLSSEELASVLTGRQIYIEILPLDFREFLLFEGLEINEKKDALVHAAKIKSFFREYMERGGFPEVVLNKDQEFMARTLRSYYEDIVGRDVVQRHNVRKHEEIKGLARFYLTNVASPISFNRLSKFR
mgnify:CR=1 FL=1